MAISDSPCASRNAGAETANWPSQQAGLASATDLVDSLNGWRADSIVLTAEQLASLLEAGLGGAAARYLDSVSVTLGQDEAAVGASLATEAIPRAALGHIGVNSEHGDHLARMQERSDMTSVPSPAQGILGLVFHLLARCQRMADGVTCAGTVLRDNEVEHGAAEHAG